MAPVDQLVRAQDLIKQADICIFDIDGTLLNSRDAVHYFAFLNAIRTVFSVEAKTDGIHMHGNTDIGILRAVAQRAHSLSAATRSRTNSLSSNGRCPAYFAGR